MHDEDPRNIFVNQRQGYDDKPPQGNDSRQNARAAQSDDNYAQRVEEMKRLAAKYEREGEGQLVKDIVNSVIEQKARGQLSNEQLKAFAARVSPLLNAEQRSRLQGLLQQLLKY